MKATLEGDYIYLEGDNGMEGEWRSTRRDVAGLGCPRHCGEEVLEATAPFLYSGAYVLIG